jgi:hypothetical protein
MNPYDRFRFVNRKNRVDDDHVTNITTNILESMNEMFKEARERKISITKLGKINRNLSVCSGKFGGTKLVENELTELINITSYDKCMFVTDDLAFFRISYYMPSMGLPVSGTITKNWIFIQEEAPLNPRKILLPRSSYPVIIEFLRHVALRAVSPEASKTIVNVSPEASKTIVNVIERWSRIRLILIGSKDQNSCLSKMPFEIIQLIRSYVDDKYSIVELNTEQNLKRETIRAQKRKIEQVENEQIEHEQNKKK